MNWGLIGVHLKNKKFILKSKIPLSPSLSNHRRYHSSFLNLGYSNRTLHLVISMEKKLILAL